MAKHIIYFLLILTVTASHAQIHIGPGQTYANVQAALAMAQPGDTIFLHTGSYKGYQGVVGLKGTAGKPIVIMPYKTDTHDISGCWQFQACEYITLYKLNFKGNASSPSRLLNVDNNGDCATQSKHIIINYCNFSEVTDGASITAFKFGGVDSFEVTNCTFKNIPNCDAFDFNVCHHGLISRNYIENCLTAGHIKGGASDITMERNMFVNASSGGWVVFEFGGDTGPQFYCSGDTFEVKNLRFYSNILIGGGRGFALSSARNCEVINNTFYNFSGATFRLLNTSNLYPKLYNNHVENNIFAFGTTAYINASQQQAGSTYFNNNIYYSFVNSNFNGPYWDSPEADLVKEQNMKIYGKDTPMFVDTATRNFHLSANSPACSSGSSTSLPQYDYYGTPYSSTRSVGAIQAPVKSNIILSEHHDINCSIYPNPFSENINLFISNDKRENLTIIIIDAVGNVVHQQYSPDLSNKQFVSLSPLSNSPNGIYILHIYSNTSKATYRLLKNN